MNKGLPIWDKKDEIISAVRNNDITIISAESGSGKSTQVPQYLYNDGYEVICTQPRRLACITLAERVGDEINDSNIVAYHTAFESTRTENTKILFCTDGLQVARGIKNYKDSILIIDEVHEWNLNIETLVAWIKKFILDGNKIKVVIMSATIDTEKLADFFQEVGSVECVSIKGRNYHIDINTMNPNHYHGTIKDLVEQGKNVLAFRPGKKEIDETINKLKEYQVDAEIIPLHGDLDSAEQRKCFWSYDRPKVIVSTNIAQTSITIPDIDAVVDDGTEKRIEVDNGIEGLFVHNISKADCLQRAGRSGRVKEGEYYLCSYRELDDRDEYSEAEIERMILDKVVLKLASVDIDAEELEFYHQPSKDSIISSKRTLRFLGLLKGNEVTESGYRVSKMPIGVRYGRMLLEAEKYDCVSDMIDIVGIMETGTLLGFKMVMTWNGTEKVMSQYSTFTNEKMSDALAELDIYKDILDRKFDDLKKAGINKKNFFRIKEFISKLRIDLGRDMNTFGTTNNKSILMRCIIAGLFDNLFMNLDSYRNEFIDENSTSYILDKKSCINTSSRFVVGMPKIIEFKDKWGDTRKMNLVSMNTVVSDSLLLELAGDDTHKVLYTMRSEYDPIETTLDLLYGITYRERFVINTEKVHVDSDDIGEYIDIINNNPELIENGLKNYVHIGSNYYKIQYEEVKSLWSFTDTIPVVYLSDENKKDILSYVNSGDDIGYVYDKHFSRVFFVYHNGKYSRKYSSIEDIQSEIKWKENREEWEKERGEIFNQYVSDIQKPQINSTPFRVINHEEPKKNRKKEMNKLIPKGTTNNYEELVNDFIPKLGNVEFDFPEFDMVGTKYIGFEYDKGVTYKLFDDEDNMNDSTNKALQQFMKKYVNDNMNAKTFVIKRAGRTFETDMSRAAKDEFQQMSAEIISDTSLDNFIENMEFLKEVYDECQQNVV